jgi:hypothetical protein
MSRLMNGWHEIEKWMKGLGIGYSGLRKEIRSLF